MICKNLLFFTLSSHYLDVLSVLEDFARSGKFISVFSSKDFIVSLSHVGIFILIDLIFVDRVKLWV